MSATAAAVVAERVALAYVTSGFTERRAACRPYDTDNLDATLALPTWAGAGPTTTAPSASEVTVGPAVPVDVAAAAIGFQIDASVAGGGHLELSVQVVAVVGGRWLADSINET